MAAKISRRAFGQALAMQAAWTGTVGLAAGAKAGAAAAPVEEVAAYADLRANPRAALKRGEFIALITDYFQWVHSSQYIDAYKSVQPTFADVTLGVTPHAREIEMALEEALVSNADGYFHPDQPMSRAEAAAIVAKAFGVPLAEGYAPGAGGGKSPGDGAITRGEARAVLTAVTSRSVAPPQVMCKAGTTAPRRYVRISTPTPGATIHYTVTFDGSEPPDPTGPAGLVYDFTADGVLQFVNPLNSTTDFRLYRLKAVARKPGMIDSPVREFQWNIVRPRSGEFQAKLVHAATATTPAVWKIHNPAEYFQANAYYIEGSQRGLLFDAGEYGYQKGNLKPLVDSLATKPYDVVLGHSHPDHAEQIHNFTSAGVTLHLSALERAGLLASNRKDFQAAGNAARVLEDGQVLDLGNVQVTAWQIPGHTNGLTTIIVNQTGWVYGSDMWGCNRPHTADTTQYQGVKVDLFLSLVQQILANYRRSSAGGRINEVTNAHQEAAVGMQCIRNFERCFQQLIDEGNSIARPSIRGGAKGGDRMSMVGDMWRDRNWMAIGPIGKHASPVDYLSKPTTAWPCGVTIDYNVPDGFRKYSVLSNIEIDGGVLLGVDVHWNAPANGVANRQANKFDPWTYDYRIRAAPGVRSLALRPRALSNHIRSLKVNQVAVRQAEAVTVPAAIGSEVRIEVVSPDGSSTSVYTFTLAG